MKQRILHSLVFVFEKKLTCRAGCMWVVGVWEFGESGHALLSTRRVLSLVHIVCRETSGREFQRNLSCRCCSLGNISANAHLVSVCSSLCVLRKMLCEVILKGIPAFIQKKNVVLTQSWARTVSLLYFIYHILRSSSDSGSGHAGHRMGLCLQKVYIKHCQWHNGVYNLSYLSSY